MGVRSRALVLAQGSENAGAPARMGSPPLPPSPQASMDPHRAGETSGSIILCRVWERAPGHCRMFSSTPGLYPPDASSILLSYDNQNRLQTLLNVPWEAKICSRLRTARLELANSGS